MSILKFRLGYGRYGIIGAESPNGAIETASVTPYTFLRDKTTSSGYIYDGWAVPGTATSSAAWRIQRETLGADGDITEIKWANGSTSFDQVYDNRASLTYS